MAAAHPQTLALDGNFLRRPGASAARYVGDLAEALTAEPQTCRPLEAVEEAIQAMSSAVSGAVRLCSLAAPVASWVAAVVVPRRRLKVRGRAP